MDHLSTTTRVLLGLLYVSTCLVLVVGFVLFWPYLSVEHQRSEWWVGFLGWTNDLTIFFWFTHFFVRHSLRGQPLRTIPWEEFRGRRLLWTSAVALTLSMAVDAGASFYVREQDRAGHARARIMEGRVEAVRSQGTPDFLQYELQGTYADGRGERHAFVFPAFYHRAVGYRAAPGLVEKHNGGLAPLLPKEAQEALRDGRMPFPFPVAYDPEFPARNWYPDLPWYEVNRFWHVSWIMLICQAILVPMWWLSFCYLIPVSVKKALQGNYILLGPPDNFLVRRLVASGAVVYWPWELYQVIPLMVEAFWFLMLGWESQAQVGFLI